jgi:hypothetical protein
VIVWIKALEKAATGNVDPTTMNFDDFYDALGMERNSSYTQVELNKFHRKAALKNHPDKGGNADAVSATILMTISFNYGGTFNLATNMYSLKRYKKLSKSSNLVWTKSRKQSCGLPWISSPQLRKVPLGLVSVW